MRAVYHERLSELSHKLGEMSGLAGSAIGRATQALLEADLSLAQRVITDHEQIVACRGYEIRPASVTLSGPASAARPDVTFGHPDCDLRLCQWDDRRAHDHNRRDRKEPGDES